MPLGFGSGLRGSPFQLPDGINLSFEEDAGVETLVDLSISSTPAAGTEESYSLKIDGNVVIKVYGEADGAGGSQDRKVLITDGSAGSPSEPDSTLHVHGAATAGTASHVVQNATDAVSNVVASFKGGERAVAAQGDEAYINFFLDNLSEVQTEVGRITWDNWQTSGPDAEMRFYVQTGGDGALREAFRARGIGFTQAQLQVPLANSTRPGLGFFGEPNTGLYMTTSPDTLGFSTAAASRMELSAGLLEFQAAFIIRTTAGDLTLDPTGGVVVDGNDGGGIPGIHGAGGGGFQISGDSGLSVGFRLLTAGSDEIEFRLNGAEKASWTVDDIAFQQDQTISARDADGGVLTFRGRDSGVGLVNVARIVGAADPYLEATLGLGLGVIAQPGTPVEGMLIYNSATNKLNFYNGTAWEVVTSA